MKFFLASIVWACLFSSLGAAASELTPEEAEILVPYVITREQAAECFSIVSDMPGNYMSSTLDACEDFVGISCMLSDDSEQCYAGILEDFQAEFSWIVEGAPLQDERLSTYFKEYQSDFEVRQAAGECGLLSFIFDQTGREVECDFSLNTERIKKFFSYASLERLFIQSKSDLSLEKHSPKADVPYCVALAEQASVPLRDSLKLACLTQSIYDCERAEQFGACTKATAALMLEAIVQRVRR